MAKNKIDPETQAIVDHFPAGTRVSCESEWNARVRYTGTVSAIQYNRYDCPQWLIIECDDGHSAEYDFRYLDVEDSRNSMVRVLKG